MTPRWSLAYRSRRRVHTGGTHPATLLFFCFLSDIFYARSILHHSAHKLHRHASGKAATDDEYVRGGRVTHAQRVPDGARLARRACRFQEPAVKYEYIRTLAHRKCEVGCAPLYELESARVKFRGQSPMPLRRATGREGETIPLFHDF